MRLHRASPGRQPRWCGRRPRAQARHTCGCSAAGHVRVRVPQPNRGGGGGVAPPDHLPPPARVVRAAAQDFPLILPRGACRVLVALAARPLRSRSRTRPLSVSPPPWIAEVSWESVRAAAERPRVSMGSGSRVASVCACARRPVDSRSWRADELGRCRDAAGYSTAHAMKCGWAPLDEGGCMPPSAYPTVDGSPCRDTDRSPALFIQPHTCRSTCLVWMPSLMRSALSPLVCPRSTL